MAGEGSSGLTACKPHGHCSSVQTDLLWLCCAHTVLLPAQLLGLSLHLGARHTLQCSICCSPSLFQRCAFLHIKMQKCSFHCNQLLSAIIKQDMQAQQKWAWAQQLWGLVLLPAEQKIVSQLEVPILSHTWRLNLAEHHECVLCLPEQPGSTTARGSPRAGDSTAVQVMQQPHSLRLLQWNLSNAGRRAKADQGNILG